MGSGSNPIGSSSHLLMLQSSIPNDGLVLSYVKYDGIRVKFDTVVDLFIVEIEIRRVRFSVCFDLLQDGKSLLHS